MPCRLISWKLFPVFPFNIDPDELQRYVNGTRNGLKCGLANSYIPSAFACDGFPDCDNGHDEEDTTCNKSKEYTPARYFKGR